MDSSALAKLARPPPKLASAPKLASDPNAAPPKLPSGTKEESGDPERIATIRGPGGCFGELALMYNVQRTATIRAMSSCRLWKMDRFIYLDLLLRDAKAQRQRLVDFVKEQKVFSGLTAEQAAGVAELLQRLVGGAVDLEGLCIDKVGPPAGARRFQFFLIALEGERD